MSKETTRLCLVPVGREASGRPLPLALGRTDLAPWWWASCPCHGVTTRRPCQRCLLVGDNIKLLSKEMFGLEQGGLLQIDPNNRNPQLVGTNRTELKRDTQLLKPHDTIWIGTCPTKPWMEFELVEHIDNNRTELSQSPLPLKKRRRDEENEDIVEQYVVHDKKKVWLETPSRKRRLSRGSTSRPKFPNDAASKLFDEKEEQIMMAESPLYWTTEPEEATIPETSAFPSRKTPPCSKRKNRDPTPGTQRINNRKESPALDGAGTPRSIKKYTPRKRWKRYEEGSPPPPPPAAASNKKSNKTSQQGDQCQNQKENICPKQPSLERRDETQKKERSCPDKSPPGLGTQAPRTPISIHAATRSSISDVSMPQCPSWVRGESSTTNEPKASASPSASRKENNKTGTRDLVVEDWETVGKGSKSALNRSLAALIVAQRDQRQDEKWLPDLLKDTTFVTKHSGLERPTS